MYIVSSLWEITDEAKLLIRLFSLEIKFYIPCLFSLIIFLLQLLKAYRIKFQKFAAHAHKDALINETFIPT